MSTYHCSVKIVSRSSGRSSVGAAAYRAGEKLTNERDGITHDYTRKGGVVYSEILLPENAPIEYSERAVLWNAVEKIETRANSQTAREIEVALPRELSYQEQANMVREYVKDNFVSRGMCADFAIHDKDKGNNNPHAHILLTMRSIDKNGKWEPKAKFVYELDKNGNKQYDPKTRKYRGRPENTNDWNKKENVEQWRESWAKMYNREMGKKSLPARVDHRSYARQGIDKEPTIHRGPAAHHMEQRGIRSDRGDINRGIEARNRAYTMHISELREDVTAYTADGASLFPYGREAFSEYGIELPEAPPMENVITYVEPREEKSREREYIEQEGKEQYRAMGTEQIQGEQGRAASRGASDRESHIVQDVSPMRYRPIGGQSIDIIFQSKEGQSIKAAPERGEGAARQRREPAQEKPKTYRMRGNMAQIHGVVLPLDKRALYALRRQNIYKIQDMAQALVVMRREGIESGVDFDRRAQMYAAQAQGMNPDLDRIKREQDYLLNVLKEIKRVEQYAPKREEIEKASVFSKKKLAQAYRIEIDALAGAERRLREKGIEPKGISKEKVMAQITALETRRRSLKEEQWELAGKSIEIEDAKRTIESVFEAQDREQEIERNRDPIRGVDR